MSAEATSLWISFHDHLEKQRRGSLERIKYFAAKAPEHAARIAGVITLVEDIHATEIRAAAMAGALTLADWYVNEACRLAQGGLIDPALLDAASLLEWLQAQPEQTVSFREILYHVESPKRSQHQIRHAPKQCVQPVRRIRRPRRKSAIGPQPFITWRNTIKIANGRKLNLLSIQMIL